MSGGSSARRGERHRLLDFACGYGRTLRFLTLPIPPGQIWASELQRDAVDFAMSEFGVHGVLSDIDPKRFDPGIHFDFIWVASLFSHVPRHLFHAWLARLVSLTAPEGIVCFSVHDECLLPARIPMPADGIHFIASSEIVVDGTPHRCLRTPARRRSHGAERRATREDRLGIPACSR